MKKTLLSLAALLASISFAQAFSPFQIGVRGGILFSNSILKFTTQDGLQYNENSSRTGYEIGIQTRVGFPAVPLFLQPELMYVRENATYPAATSGGTEVDAKQNWMEVPVLLGWKVLGPLHLKAGPVFRFPMSEVLTDLRTSASERVAPRLNDFILGYQVGVGVDLMKLTIDARYCGNITKASSGDKVSDMIKNIDIKDPKFTLSLGWLFLK